MDTKPRQLDLDELLRLKWLLGSTTALIALWTVFFLDIEALSLVAVATVCLLVVTFWPALPARVPVRVWKLAVPAIVAISAFDFYLSPDTLPVLIRLAILLVVYRAIAYRKKREDLQLLVLGLFLIVVAGVLTVSLGFAFLLLAFTAAALGFLFVVNLIDAVGAGAVRTPDAETAWTRLAWGKFLRRLCAVADWRLLAFSTLLFVTVVGMSGLLFLIIPRFEMASGFFLDRYITRQSRSGFTDTVKYGDVTELTQDTSVAMRVDIADTSQIREPPYWRLVVLDEYTPEGFRVSAGLRAELLSTSEVRQHVQGRPLGRRVNDVGGQWTFYLEPGVSRYLPLPGGFGMLRLRDPVPLQASMAHRVVALRTESMTMTAFQLEGVELDSTLPNAQFPSLLRQFRDNPPPPSARAVYDPRFTLQGPDGEANRAALQRVVQEITGGGLLGAADFAQRAMAWLQAKHAYALSVRVPGAEGQDAIVRWLNSNEPGFCEYFAGALTVLARAAGHPARVVAGFHGGALNGFENYYMVRNSDAHAWVEIHDGQTNWLRFDPTPSGRSSSLEGIVDAIGRGEDSSWSARLDSLRVLWYRRIVNFDSRQQIQMIDQVKTFSSNSGKALRERLEEFTQQFKAWLAKPWSFTRFARVAVLAVGAAALIWLLGRVIGMLGQEVRGREGAHDPVRRQAGQWIGRLRSDPQAREVVVELERLRYGRRETWPEPKAVFRRAREAKQGR